MNIILTDIALLSVFIVPVVPVDTPINSDGAAETSNSIDGRFRIIDNEELRSISWNSFFPVNKNYAFVKKGSKANGYIYVSFIELMKKYKLPIRVICTTEKKVPFINMLASIDTFNYKIDKTGDIVYQIALTEFPEKFIEFVNREKEVWKYIKNLDVKSTAKNLLQKHGLLQ